MAAWKPRGRRSPEGRQAHGHLDNRIPPGVAADWSRRMRKRLREKFESFGFHVVRVEDGNDFDQLRAAFAEARATKGVPTAIVMKTVKGKGISYMENQVGWHGKAPNDEEYAIAVKELEEAEEALCQK